MFRVRIFKVEHYMSTPIPDLDVTYSDFRKSSVKHVPVIRIFGSTPTGEKTCVHVHGVFPYICIPYDGSEPHSKLSYQLAASLDKAINIASGYSTSNTQHVYKVVLVSGIPFYGYHKKRHQYLKIYFYKPSVIKQAVQLLQNGAILNKIFEPHEAHISFILQFFIDFNLYGMSFVDFQQVKYRKTNNAELLRDIPATALLPDTVPAVSVSQYEIDVAAIDIINRPSSQGNCQIANPGLTAIWEDENRRRARAEGTPLEAPQLHSQRPPLKSTASELFYLRKLCQTLDNPAQFRDDSSVSGEALSLTNKSYAIEEPLNTPALDASFVSMHTQHSPDITVPFEVDGFNDTIVDEDLALLNMSMSQRLTQTLDKSLIREYVIAQLHMLHNLLSQETVDHEDLELLDVLETLADTRSNTVDENSELGSQASRGKSVPFSTPDEHDSEGEENWHDETLVAEEDEVMKLFDLTMPDIDEEDILRNELRRCQSEDSQEQTNILQVDGAFDDLASSALLRRNHQQKSKKCIIPQVDGVNDLPSKSVRRSLGMRGAKSKTSSGQGKRDYRYSSTGELIFNTRKIVKVNSEPPLQENASHQSSSNLSPQELPSCSLTGQSSVQKYSLAASSQNSGVPCLTSEASSLPVTPVEIESGAQVFSQLSNPPSEQDALLFLLPPSEQCSTHVPSTSVEDVVLSYFPFPMQNELPLEDFQPDDVDESGHNCPDFFIEMLAKKKNDCLLRGDPSLYPQSPLEREESLTDLISASIPEEKCIYEIGQGSTKVNEESRNHGSGSIQVRRSLRLASHDTLQGPPATEVVKESKPSERGDAAGNSSANALSYSFSDLEYQGMLPELSNTVLQQYQEVSFDWGSNADASCSDSEVYPLDSEMNRLTGALQNNRMEEILQTSPDSTEKPSIGRLDELKLYLENQKLQCNGQTSCTTPHCNSKVGDKDPVTDALLKRGVMAKPGRPPSQGKNLDLLEVICKSSIDSAFYSDGKTTSPKKTSVTKEVKKAARQRRKMKLSLAEQKRVKKTSVSVLNESRRQPRMNTLLHLKPCSVVVKMLTCANISAVCREFKVGFRDKSALPGDMDKSFNLKTKINISKSDILCGGKSRRSYENKQLPRLDMKSFAADTHGDMQNFSQQNQCKVLSKPNNSQGETSLEETALLGLSASLEVSANLQPPPKQRRGRKKKIQVDIDLSAPGGSEVQADPASAANLIPKKIAGNFQNVSKEKVGSKQNGSQGQTSIAESALVSVDSKGLGRLLKLSQESSADLVSPQKRRSGRQKKTVAETDSTALSGSDKPADSSLVDDNNALQKEAHRNVQGFVEEKECMMDSKQSQGQTFLAAPSFLLVNSQGSGALFQSSQETAADVPSFPKRRSERSKGSGKLLESSQETSADLLSFSRRRSARSKQRPVAIDSAASCTSDVTTEPESSVGKNALPMEEPSKVQNVAQEKKYKIDEDSGHTEESMGSGVVLESSCRVQLFPKRKSRRRKKTSLFIDSTASCSSDIPTDSEAAGRDIKLEKKSKIKQPCFPPLKPKSVSVIQIESKCLTKLKSPITLKEEVSMVDSTKSFAPSCTQDAAYMDEKEEVSNHQLAAVQRLSLTTTIVRNKLGNYSTRPGMSKHSLDRYSRRQRRHDVLDSTEGSKLSPKCDKMYTAVSDHQSTQEESQKFRKTFTITSNESKTQSSQIVEKLSLVTGNVASNSNEAETLNCLASDVQNRDKPLLCADPGNSVTSLKPLNPKSDTEKNPSSPENMSQDRSSFLFLSAKKKKVHKLSSSSSEEESCKPVKVSDSVVHNVCSESLNTLPPSKSSTRRKVLTLSSSSSDEESNEAVKVPDIITKNMELASKISNNLSQSTSGKELKLLSSSSEGEISLPGKAPDSSIKNVVLTSVTHGNLPQSKSRRNENRTSRQVKRTPQSLSNEASIPPINAKEEKVAKYRPISSGSSDTKSKENLCEKVDHLKPRLARKASSSDSQEAGVSIKKVELAKHLTSRRTNLSKFKEVAHSSIEPSKAVTARRTSSSAVQEHASDGCTQTSSLHQTEIRNILKDYKIPKKSDYHTTSNFSNDQDNSSVHVMYNLSGSTKEEGVNHSTGNESDLFISLDTSDLILHLSSDDTEGKSKPSTATGSHSKATKFSPCASEYSLGDRWVLGNVGREHGQSAIADGLSSINRANHSSGSQFIDDVHCPVSLKRKWCAEMNEEYSKEENKDFAPINEDAVVSPQVPVLSVEEIPKSISQWFAQPYGPWSLWSPNISPNSTHHGHFFSPPRAVSPDKTDTLGVGSIASTKNHCINNKEISMLNANIEHSHAISQNTFHSALSIDPTLNYVNNEEEKCLPINASVKLHPEFIEDGPGKTCQSMLDLFSETSHHSDQERSNNEAEQCVAALSPIILNASLSNTECPSIKLTTDFNDCSEHHRNLSSSQNRVSKTSGKAGVQFTCHAQESSSNLSPQNETKHQEFKSSGESSDLPCGQDQGQDNLRIIVKGLCPLSTAFKPAHKPPSRQEVKDTLPSYNIPEVVHQGPFFSKMCDVKRKLEVGGNVLDLMSKSCVHLEEFHSHIQGLKGLKMQQKKLLECYWGLSQVKGDLNQLMSYHLQARKALITPIKKPPSVQEVKLWCKARGIFNQKKMFMPIKEEVKDGYEVCNRKENIPTSSSQQHMKEVDQHFHSSPTLSTESTNPSISQNEVIQSSTPNVHVQKAGKCGVPSPLLTPILQSNSQSLGKQTSSTSKQYLKKLVPSLLLPLVEKDEDLGVQSLELEASVVSIPSESIQDASLKRFLTDTQFYKEASSSVFRNVSDASACEIKGLNASPGFKMVLENLQSAKTLKEYQFLTILTVEIHICTCGSLNPDPERDPIRAIFYSVWSDVPPAFRVPPELNGIIVANFNESSIPVLNRCGVESSIEYASNETSLLRALISLVRKWDPDILAGFETEMLSWGYVLQRASVLGLNFIHELSRVPSQKEGKHSEESEDNGLSGLNITGRVVLDVWRLFRSEVALQSYTFENLMYHILHQRVSHHSFESLSRWWENPTHLLRWITVQNYQLRVQGVMKLLDQLDIIGRTSELARLFGIQFFEVLSRGSQFRVESMMLRLAKPSNYIPVSPSVQQRAHMKAPECVPLIMEPESRFYSDPLIVLDFQSLYPSMIIAYNYCFSTCLGRVEHLGKSSHFEFGCSELHVKRAHLEQLRGNITASPCGVAFVTKTVRQGILPRMLEEILEARLAVKQSMKHHKDDHTLQRVLHARQLGLKLIANVTYGYTSANFSGRMPCIEVGDSVVSKGRETLERAISLVHSNCEWGARVVYGDTDSLFVLVPGRSRQEAFRIGAEIASAVTHDNPSPVKLKLEKVYQPSILQTKKRYVGFMYESADQKQPIYEAKGIETVRRDGCPAVSKMLEKSLRILFETRDVSSVKSYVSRQFSKLLNGRANIQDLIYAREYRGKANYRPGACVPALELTKRWLRHDRRAEPRIGERVPYIIVNGPPGSALIHLVRHPSELINDSSLRYNAVYYVTRAIIPPLARCFSLIGADVPSWYADLPRKNQLSLPNLAHAGLKKTISQYFSTIECVSCGVLTHGGVCLKCRANPQLLAVSVMSKIHTWESIYTSITKICQSCLGRLDPLDCTSLDCPITYRRHQSSQKYNQSDFLTKTLSECGIAFNSS